MSPTYDLAALGQLDLELAGRPMPTPRYATKLTPGLRNRAHQVGVAGKLLNTPLIPWQAHAAAIATEQNPPGSPLFWRRQLVILVVPRQAGKTALSRALKLDRALHRPGSDIRHTAQLGKYASDLWGKLADNVETSPLGSWCSIKRGKGAEVLTLPTRSTIRPFAPGREALHSTSPNLVEVDEAWAFSEEQGGDLRRAIRPAQITHRDRQLVIISAAGDENSAWLDELIAIGRASVDDPHSTVGYVEFSPEETADPYDPDTWLFHPGLGHLISMQDLAGEADGNPLRDFVRSFMNLSLKVGVTLVDLDAWDELAVDELPTAGDDVVLGFDVAFDRTGSSIWCAWTVDGITYVAVVDHRPGAAWLLDALLVLARELPSAHLVSSAGDGHVGVVAAHLQRELGEERVTIHNPTTAAQAWSAFRDQITDTTLRHPGSSALRTALEVAAERPMGDAGIVLSTRHSRGPIDALRAAVAAAHHATTQGPAAVQLYM